MKNLRDYKKIILLSLLSMTVLGGYIFFLDILASNNDRISDILSEISREDEREVALRLAGKNLYDTRKDRGVLENLFVPQDGVVSYVEAIEKIGERVGVVVEIETLELEKSNTEILENISLRLVATGDYLAVRRFLSEMQEMSIASEWRRASITTMPEIKASGHWTLSLESRALKFK